MSTDNAGAFAIEALVLQAIDNAASTHDMSVLGDIIHVLGHPKRQLLDAEAWRNIRCRYNHKEEQMIQMRNWKRARTFKEGNPLHDLDDDAGETEAREHAVLEELERRAEMYDYE